MQRNSYLPTKVPKRSISLGDNISFSKFPFKVRLKIIVIDKRKVAMLK